MFLFPHHLNLSGSATRHPIAQLLYLPFHNSIKISKSKSLLPLPNPTSVYIRPLAFQSVSLSQLLYLPFKVPLNLYLPSLWTLNLWVSDSLLFSPIVSQSCRFCGSDSVHSVQSSLKPTSPLFPNSSSFRSPAFFLPHHLKQFSHHHVAIFRVLRQSIGHLSFCTFHSKFH